MKRFLIYICILLVFLVSCEKEEPSDIQKTDEIVTEDTNEPDTSVDVGVESPSVDRPDVPELPADAPQFLSYTTGMPCTEEMQSARPIAVMYNNNKISYPQNSISKADIVYECNAEGGLTRLMALFSDWKSLGEIGSVRSARDYFISLSQGHGAIYVNAGGSPSAYTKLKNSKVDYVDGVNMYSLPSGLFYRSKSRIKSNGYEHSLMTDGEKISKAIEFCKYSDRYDDSFVPTFKFYEAECDNSKLDGTANSVKLEHSTYITVKFEYNSDAGTYSKYSFGSPHIDGINGEQLTFENIIVLLVDEDVVDDEGRLSIDLTSGGKGYYFNNGRYCDISWSRASEDSPFVFKTNDEELMLNPGKTHITLFNKYRKDKITIK